jgi:hypothetical protein
MGGGCRDGKGVFFISMIDAGLVHVGDAVTGR